MPWHISKRSGEFCVIKDADDTVEACHATRAEAEAHQSALYASELDQSVKEDGYMSDSDRWQPLTDWVENLVTDIFHTKAAPMKTVGGKKFPAGDFLVVEDRDKPTTWHLQVKRNGKVDHNLMGSAWAALHQGYRGNKYEGPGKQDAIGKLRRLYKAEEMPVPGGKETSLTVWKEDDGVMHWLGVFSNNYRDDDLTPEILSAEAHKDFERAIDAGEWPKPALRFWHIPGADFGSVDTVAFDEDTGMQLAMGTVAKGMEHVAAYCQRQNYIMSHGMPPGEIERDESDPTIITRYRSAEVSALPPWAAANKLTQFGVKESEGESMTIPEQKLEELTAAGFDVEKLTAALVEGKQQAEDEQRESKEVKADEIEDAAEAVVEAPAEPVVEATEPESEAVEVTEPEQPDAPVFDMEELAAGIVTAVDARFTEHFAPLNERLDTLEGQMKELAESTEQSLAEQLELTPAASLSSMVKSMVIGKPDARVDGRSSEAKDAPKENRDKGNGKGTTGIPFLDSMLVGDDWRDGMKAE